MHSWTGLFAVTSLIVFAAAGIHATLRPAEEEPLEAATREVPFRAPANLGDKELADLVHAELALPLTKPIPTWAVRRDRQHRLRLTFHTPSGCSAIAISASVCRSSSARCSSVGRCSSSSDSPEPRRPVRGW